MLDPPGGASYSTSIVAEGAAERLALRPPDYTFDETRLAALDGYDILDTAAEPGFDDIVQIASAICDVPVALVSFVTSDRQWFKARVGFAPCETDLSRSVCAHVLVEPDILVIPDLTKDERTRANPLVTNDPRIRFYAGAPLRSQDGQAIGSLCAIDTKPRPKGLSDTQAATLRSLARQVMTQLELRRALRERETFLVEQREAAARRGALLTLGDRLREVSSVGEMTQTASAIVGETLGAIRAGFGRLGERDEILTVEPDWTRDGMASVAGRHRFADYGDLTAELLKGEPLVIEDVLTDPRTAADPKLLLDMHARALVNMPVRERGRTVALLLVHHDEPRRWTPEVLTFLRNVADRVEVGVARLRAEADQHVLNQELSHRMKNTFAMVQAIAAQTLRAVPDQEPVEAFVQRIHALSSAHDVLLQQSWVAARMSEIVSGVLAATISSDRLDISGEELTIGPRATLSLSLLLHELSTNAVKYGALSNQEGRVAVAWHVDWEGETGEAVVTWVETGGPAVGSPSRRGFGSRLIRMGLVGTGGVDLRYLPTGLEAEFRAPLAQMQQS